VTTSHQYISYYSKLGLLQKNCILLEVILLLAGIERPKYQERRKLKFSKHYRAVIELVIDFEIPVSNLNLV
jgi:hypothetical protein